MTLNSFTCSICGEQEHVAYMGSQREGDPVYYMKQRGCCFTCGFWLEIISEKEKHTIIEGQSYVVLPMVKAETQLDRWMLGHGGRLFRIEYFNNPGVIVESNNVWYQGVIPERWRKDLPDTARFIYAEPKKGPRYL